MDTSDRVKESIHWIMEGVLEHTMFEGDPKSISLQVTLTFPDEKAVMKKTLKDAEIPDTRQMAIFEGEVR
jgi:hypothetical protein